MQTKILLKKVKTRNKTKILLITSFLTITSLFSLFIYYSLSKYNNQDFYKLLEIRALTSAKYQLDDVANTDLEDISEFFDRLPQEKDYVFQIKDDYSLEADSLGVPHSFFQEILTEGEAVYKIRGTYFKGLKYQSSKGSFIAISSAENYFDTHHASYLKRTLIIAIFISVFFSMVISFFFSKYVFMPIRKVTERVKSISSENLHLRLDPANKNDELKELAYTFNNMLDRLETAFETQNNFISNASHELRTPLTAIIGEADVCLSKLRKPEEYIDSLKIVLEEAERLEKKTRALLFLAQTGFDGKIQKFENVRIDQLLWDVKETIERINPKSKIQFDTSLLPENPAKLKVSGNEQLLHLAFTNIISNGCKYSDFQPVYVSIGATDDYVIVIVKDSGIGIPIEELKYIYDPFFRASNTNNYEGYGIGLPLTRNIVRIHKGELLVSSSVGQGTIVQVKIPTV